MEVNKADLLKNIQNFIGAENDLAVKEAQHQISIFKAVYEQEIEAYEKLEEKENTPNPADCLLYTSPSPRDTLLSRMPSSA